MSETMRLWSRIKQEAKNYMRKGFSARESHAAAILAHRDDYVASCKATGATDEQIVANLRRYENDSVRVYAASGK